MIQHAGLEITAAIYFFASMYAYEHDNVVMGSLAYVLCIAFLFLGLW